MAVIVQTLRGAAALSGFFAGLPWVAWNSARAKREDARAMAIAHAARFRRLGRIEIHVEGAGNVPRDEPFVLVYNQTSIVDDLGNGEVLASLRVDRVVLAAEYGLIPFFRRAAPRWGIELLRRHDRSAVDRALADLAAVLRAGGRVSMAPEGRLSPDGKVGHFKRGAFLLAIRAGGVPVVPMAVRGGREILRPGSLRMRSGRLQYRIGEPISTTRLGEADAPAVAERARMAIAVLHDAAGAG